MIYNIVDDARWFASIAHRAVGQKRKYTGEDYEVHPEAVVSILRHNLNFIGAGGHPENGATEVMYAAAYLHDVLEDTKITEEYIRDLFGSNVAAIVVELTEVKNPLLNRKGRKLIEASRLAKTSYEVQTIKCADIIDNLRSIVEHDKKFAKVVIEEASVLHRVMTKAHPAMRDLLNNAIQEAKEVVYG